MKKCKKNEDDKEIALIKMLDQKIKVMLTEFRNMIKGFKTEGNAKCAALAEGARGLLLDVTADLKEMKDITLKVFALEKICKDRMSGKSGVRKLTRSDEKTVEKATKRFKQLLKHTDGTISKTGKKVEQIKKVMSVPKKPAKKPVVKKTAKGKKRR